jgi:hypothetical protein
VLGQSGYSLSCDVTVTGTANPSITYQWTKNNGTQTQVGTDSVLSFSPLRLSDTGQYTCQATISSPCTISEMDTQDITLQSEYGYIIDDCEYVIYFIVYKFGVCLSDNRFAMLYYGSREWPRMFSFMFMFTLPYSYMYSINLSFSIHVRVHVHVHVQFCVHIHFKFVFTFTCTSCEQCFERTE